MGARVIDHTGKTFGKLLAIKRVPAPPGKATSTRRRAWWLVRCECGTEKVLDMGNVTNGATRSCGCIALEYIKNLTLRHGKSGVNRIAEYDAWRGAKGRTSRPTDASWKHYGGRGIRMHPEWFKSFEKFYEYIGPKPSPEYSLDRIDVNGNYEPGNVRWATPKEQVHNRRLDTQSKEFIDLINQWKLCFNGPHDHKECEKLWERV